MSIARSMAMGKPIMPSRLRPSQGEGLNIQYEIKRTGKTLASLGRRMNVTRQAVSRVVLGKIRSARIESEIARLLGKADWNEVVLEARSEVQKKPAEAILREMEQRAQAARKAAKKRMATYAAENYERAVQLIPDSYIAQKEQKRKAAKAKGGAA